MSQFPDNLHAEYDARSNGGLRFFEPVIIKHLARHGRTDLVVIGYGVFVAIVAFGIVALLAAHRH